MDKRDRKTIAKETLLILEKGFYPHPENNCKVFIEPQLSESVRKTKIYDRHSIYELFSIINDLSPSEIQSEITVIRATTLEALYQISGKTGILNFASAKNPGGGFLNGAQAQEETLARSSGLYSCLITQENFYENNKRERKGIYLDNMIVSPGVPFFRSDNGSFLKEPRFVDVISMPAVNATIVKQTTKNSNEAIINTMRLRIKAIIAIAIHLKLENIILGAWGCGVFGNDPWDISRIFREVLNDPLFINRIPKIIFAIPNHAMKNIFEKNL
jgi:uncharacterized protein (TIGR02452 family)